MHVSQLKTGLKVKINIEKGMEITETKNPEEFVSRFFGDKPEIQKWMKEHNLFEIVKVDNMAAGVLTSGERWQFVLIKPILVGDITENCFSYETENENGDLIIISTVTIENILLEINE